MVVFWSDKPLNALMWFHQYLKQLTCTSTAPCFVLLQGCPHYESFSSFSGVFINRNKVKWVSDRAWKSFQAEKEYTRDGLVISSSVLYYYMRTHGSVHILLQNLPFILISTKHLWKFSCRSCNSDEDADNVRHLSNTVLFWNREHWAPRDNQGARDQRGSQDLRAPTGCRVSLGRRAKRLDVLSFHATICSRAATNDYHCYQLICLLFDD